MANFNSGMKTTDYTDSPDTEVVMNEGWFVQQWSGARLEILGKSVPICEIFGFIFLSSTSTTIRGEQMWNREQVVRPRFQPVVGRAAMSHDPTGKDACRTIPLLRVRQEN